MTPFGNKISVIDKIWIDLAPNFTGFEKILTTFPF